MIWATGICLYFDTIASELPEGGCNYWGGELVEMAVRDLEELKELRIGETIAIFNL